MATKSDILRVMLQAEGGRQVRVELSQVERGIEQVDGVARRAGDGLRAMRGVLGALAGGAFAAMVRNSIAAVDSTNDYARALGITTDALTALEYAAGRVQVPVDKLRDILKDTAEKIGDAYATGGGEAIEVIDRLGLSLEDLVRMSPDRQLLAIARQLGGVGTQAEKIQILEALASDASLLLPLIENDAKRLTELTGEAERLGYTIKQIDADKASRAQEALDSLSASSNAVANAIAVNLAPELEKTVDLLNEAIPDATRYAGQALNALIEDTQVAARWLAAWNSGHIGFWEWLSAGPDEAKARLAELREELLKPLPQPQPEAPEPIDIAGPGRGLEKTDKALAAVADYRAQLEHANRVLGLTQQAQALLNVEQRIGAEIAKAAAANNRELADAWASARPELIGLVELHNARAAALEQERAAEAALEAMLDDAISAHEEMERAYDQRKKSNIDLIQSLRDELSLVGLSSREYEINTALRQLSSDATEEQQQAVRRLTSELYDAREAQWQLNRAASETGRTFANAFEAAVFEADNLGAAIDRLAADLARLIYRETIGNPLEQAITGMVGSWLGGSGSLFGSTLGSVGAGTAGVGSVGSVPAFIFHGGRGPGETFARRSVHPAAWADAPRHHTGIGPGERAAVIKDSEGVFTGGQMRALAPVSRIRQAVSEAAPTITLHQSYNVDMRGNESAPQLEARFAQMLDRNKRETVAEVQRLVNRGGGYARSLGARA